MTFDEFYADALRNIQHSALLADFVDDVTQYFLGDLYPDVEMEVLYNKAANTIVQHTGFDVLYQIAFQRAELEVQSRYDFTDLTVIYNESAIEPFREIVEKLYKYHKSHPKGQLTLPTMAEDTYEDYMMNLLQENDYIYEVDSIIDTAEEELSRDKIEKVYKDLDKIEANWTKAINEIWQNEAEWIDESVRKGMQELEYYSDEDQQKEKYLKWVFENR